MTVEFLLFLVAAAIAGVEAWRGKSLIALAVTLAFAGLAVAAYHGHL